MSLRKTLTLATLTLVAVAVLGLTLFTIRTQPVSAAECTINSAQFMNGTGGSHGEGWYTEDLRRLIPMQIVTSDCEGQEIEVSLSQINENTGALLNAVDVLDREAFTVPSSNKLDIYAWNGDENCAPTTSTCTYAISVHDPAGQGFSSYSAANGTISYPCDGSCLVGPDWELVANDNSDGGLCKITGATISPSGVQPGNFYQDDARPLVDISIQTEDCVGHTIEFSVRAVKNNDVDRDVPQINNRPITIGVDSSVTIKAVAGEDWCGQTEEGSDGCTYYLVVENPAEIEFNFYETTKLSYQCDGTLLEYENTQAYLCGSPNPQKWYIQEHNGVDPETGETVFEEALPGATLTEGAPCVLGTEATGLEFDEDCYALLAPIGDLKEIKGDITLGSYVNILVSTVIGIAGLLAVVMIVVGGIQYMTTDALAGKSNARETITKALLGLILALGSYLILKTINPQLLIVEPNIPVIEYTVVTNETGPDGQPIRVKYSQEYEPNNACPGQTGTESETCVAIPASIDRRSSGTKSEKSLVTRLALFNNKMNAENISWSITEAWQPSRTHKAACHGMGTCVDANHSIGNSGNPAPEPEDVKKFIEAATSVNLCPVYEVKTVAQKTRLTDAGVPDNRIKVYGSWISAPHYSIYNGVCVN